MMQVLVPMAGSGMPFSVNGQVFPKSLAEVHGIPLVSYAVESIRLNEDMRFLFVISEEERARFHLDNVLRLMAPECSIVATRGKTGGALCSALLAIDDLNPDEPLIVCNGDQFIVDDTADKALADFRRRDLDVGILTFESIHPRWSYVLLNQDGFVEETAEKDPISRHATVGIYYYKTASVFIKSAEASIRKHSVYSDQYYICPSINEVILVGGRVGAFKLDGDMFYPLGTPEDVERFTKKFTSSPISIDSK